MKKASVQFTCSMLIVAYCSGSFAASLPSKLLKVEDGDTLVVEIEGVENRIQISGIDAPENTDNAKFQLDIRTTGLDAAALLVIGNAATEHLKSLLPSGGTVMIDADMNGRDKYGRVPAIVANSNGLQLNEKMVEDGYAAVLTRYPLNAEFKTRLQQKQDNAKKANRGLWGKHPKTTGAWFGDSILDSPRQVEPPRHNSPQRH